MDAPFIHPSALVESDQIGDGTRIWAFAHILPDVIIGEACNIGDHAFLESGVRLGRGVTVKNNVLLWKGVEVGDYAFLGPGAVFTNDLYPRSPRAPNLGRRYDTEDTWLKPTRVEEGVTVGANATIVCGTTLGRYCMVGAGSVVTRDVEPYQLVLGNPAKFRGWVDASGVLLKETDRGLINPETGQLYHINNHQLEASNE